MSAAERPWLVNKSVQMHDGRLAYLCILFPVINKDLILILRSLPRL